MSESEVSEVFTRVPSFNLPSKPGQLSSEQIKQFFSEGFLIVPDFFAPGELEPSRDAISEMVEGLAQKLYTAGKINKLCDEFGLFQRLTELNKAFPGATALLHKENRPPQAFRDLWSNDRLLNVVEQLIGPDIGGYPVWNLRVKTPYNVGADVPWHQDSAYFDERSYDHVIVVGWIPFLDTGANNGGMQVLRGSHRRGKIAQHSCCPGDTQYLSIEEEEIERSLGVNIQEDTVTCDVPYGGILLFTNKTVHRSLPNQSNDVRWSVDLRWQSPHEPWGAYDLADGIVLRTADNPDLIPDWKTFTSVTFKEAYMKRHFKKYHEVDEFDTTVTGPWFERWPILHHNRHTEAFQPWQK